MLQRSDEWYAARLGRFTASRASELLTNGSRKMTEDELITYKEAEPKGRRTTIDVVGDSLETYALDKAIEELFGIDKADSFVSYDMQRGIDLEPYAFDLIAYIKAEEFLEVKKCEFIKYGDHAGCSPDGYVSDNSNLEIKCPKRTNFFKIVAHGLSEVDPKYIDQVQYQMMCTDTEKTRFVNYFQENNKEFWHEIIIPRDEVRINLINARLQYAIERKLFYIDKIQKNSQFTNLNN